MQHYKYRLVRDWSNEFYELYRKHDSCRSPEEIWISCMAYFSTIGEAIRKSNYSELLQSATHAFNWMCTFIKKCNTTDDQLFKCNNDFCDVVYIKFPGVCGHCTNNKCDCNPFEIDKQKDKAGKYHTLYSKWRITRDLKFTMNDWINMFKGIYGGRIYLSTLEDIGFHFLEEAGEEAQAIRGLAQMRGILNANIEGVNSDFLATISNIDDLINAYNQYLKNVEINYSSKDHMQIKARLVKSKMDLIIEFADTFSWFCAILVKLQMIGHNLSITYDFEEALEEEYGAKGHPLKCPTCKDEDCKCVFFPPV